MAEVIRSVSGPGHAPGAVAVDCLAGGGNMGALMRGYDWSGNPLGPVEGWPQSLRTAVSIMLASGFPMLVLWGDEYIQLYNDAYRPVLGTTKHPAALGQRARECWPEIWDNVLGPMFGQVKAGGEPIWSEDLLFVLDRNGYFEETYFTFSYSAIRDESGAPGGILVTCVETTDRVLSERRLRTLRELSARSASHSVFDVCRSAAEVLGHNTLDLPFTLLYLSQAGQARLCAASGVATGTAASPEEVPADGDEPWPVNRVATSGRLELMSEFAVPVPRLPGAAGPEPVTAAILPVAQPGQSPAFGSLVVGLSPRRAFDAQYGGFLELVAGQIATLVGTARAMQDERDRVEALASLDRAKTTFFSNVSHEFRTPLTLLIGPTEDALASPERALSGEALAAAYRNELRLLKLVNALLDFSRIEAGRARATYRREALGPLTRDLASTFRSVIEHAGLTFDVDCRTDSEAYVDRDMWEKIVLNLLSNAFKFTFEGGVRVDLSESADVFQLTVSDTGGGIPESELPHVFERFHRVQDARSRSYEGSGIGLALVQELVHMHGGTIDVQSRVNAGTTFAVRIPAGAAHLPAGQVDANAPPASPAVAGAAAYVEEARRWLPDHSNDFRPVGAPLADAATPAQVPAADPSVRILIVDDNPDMRDYLARLVRDRWSVETAADGESALASVRRERPALVLADVMMPGLDGFALLRELRADPATRAIPVIMLSARAGEEARIEGLEAGADDYLVKPFSARELVTRVDTQVELQRLRAHAADEHERLLALFRTAPAAIAVVRGPNHVFEMANELYLNLVGRNNIVGKPGREALPELSGQGIWDLLDGVFATGAPYAAHDFPAMIDRLGTGELDTGYFDFVLQPIRDAHGAVDATLIHAVEITEAVVARRAIEEARQAAESANRAKDEFLAMLGHELRNPLAPILTALQLMNLRGDDGATRERAVIDRQVRHLVRLVDDLLDVSRIARGKLELRKEPTELAVIVARAIEMASPLLEERHQNLSVDVPRSGLIVEADPARLAQVVMNLLTNAAKYTEPRGRITVRARRDGSRAEVSIRDTGIGLSAEMLPRVFDLFVQGSQAMDRSKGGLGLGLTIVRSIVGLHGGTIEARSDGVGRGSEFVITLPAFSSARQDERPTRRPARPRKPAHALRILIVDDNRDAAQMTADALAAMGHTTRVAHDGPEAILIAREFVPDVALLDLGLPVMDGYELASHLHALGNRRPPPILVAVTGYGQDDDRRRSKRVGFHSHMVKPVDLESLNKVLARIARNRLQHRPPR